MAIGALPVIGIAVGLAFTLTDNAGPAMIHGIEMPKQTVLMAEAADAGEVDGVITVAALEPEFSATEEYEKYQMTLSTLYQCGGGYNSTDTHFRKAASTYREANSDKIMKLSEAASAERRARVEAQTIDIPDSQLGIFIASATGQLERDARRSLEVFQAEQQREIDSRLGYLGANPSNPECIQFRNEVIMGKHNIRLG